jgi:hypothetical protein
MIVLSAVYDSTMARNSPVSVIAAENMLDRIVGI